MPRLPDKSALGPLTDAALPTSVITPQQYGANLIPDAMAQAGRTVEHLGDQRQEQQDTLDLITADKTHQAALKQLQLASLTDPDYNTMQARFEAAAADHTNQAAAGISNPQIRQRWLPRAQLENDRAGLHIGYQQRRLASEAKAGEVEDALREAHESYVTADSDDERRRHMDRMEDILHLADGSGLFSPRHSYLMRDKYLHGALEVDGNKRIATGDAAGVVSDLTGGNSNAKVYSKGTLSDVGLNFIKRKEDYQPSAYRDGFLPNGQPRWSSGWGTLSREGETPTKAEHERRLLDETSKVDKWIKKNVSADLTQAQHDALVSFGYNLGTGNLDKLKDDINSGNAQQVAQRMLSFNQARDNNTGVMGINQGLRDRRGEEAQMYMGGGPSQRYAMLKPDRQRALLFHAKTALTNDSAQEIKRDIAGMGRDEDPPVDADGLTSIQRGAKYRSRNQTSVDQTKWDQAAATRQGIFGSRAPGVPEDSVDRRPLSDLTRQEADARISKIKDPAVQAKVSKARDDLEKFRGDDPAQSVDGVLLKGKSGPQPVTDENGNVHWEQGEDSDLRIHTAPEVRSVMDKTAARTPDVLSLDQNGQVILNENADPKNIQAFWSQMFDARQRAQERAGLFGASQNVMTRNEARRLFQAQEQDITKMDEGTFGNTMRETEARAKAMYGPNWQRALHDAALLMIKDKAHRDQAGNLAAGLLSGRLDPRDLWGRQGAQEAWTRDRSWWFGGNEGIPEAPSAASQGERNVMRDLAGRPSFDPWADAPHEIFSTPNPTASPDALFRGRGGTGYPNIHPSHMSAPGVTVGTYPQPTERNIESLRKRRADLGWRTADQVFDGIFGVGAAQRALGPHKPK